MEDKCSLKFASPATKQIPQKSGVNWWNAHAHVSPGDAYIPIRQCDLEQHTSMFPDVSKKRGKEVINVKWDDGREMKCSFEGTQEYNGKFYPKQISSDGDKSILGSYIRERMNLSLEHVITKEDFANYGKDHIDIIKNEDGTFSFDFRPITPKKGK